MTPHTFLSAALVLALSSACSGKDATDDTGVEPPDDTSSADDTGTEDTDVAPADADGDGFDETVDCDDGSISVHPGADELCDGADNDCDGTIDEADSTDATTWYADSDGDGWGISDTTTTACSAPAGFVLNDGDCNDGDPSYHPGSLESDCTDPNDYNCDGSVGWADADGDGFAACEDCDDNSASVNDDADEVCDGADNDCDSEVDEDSATDATTWYGDADGDGHGGSQFQQTTCTVPPGYVATADDCNDLDPTSYPGASEVCDEADNDCDTAVDEGVTSTWYADTDSDGFGDASSTTQACAPPPGYSTNSADCDDTAATVSPAALETCDGVDNDCDTQIDESDAINTTTWYTDADSDGYGDPSTGQASCSAQTDQVSNNSDCNDDPVNGGANQNPGATETCDGVDNNCSGTADDNATDATTWWLDSDGDGYGAATHPVSACSQPSGYVNNDTDCNDSNSTENPGATEICDGLDNNCNALVDDGSAGVSASCPAASCDTILAGDSTATDGLYWLDPDDDGDTSDAWEAYCDMSTDGGGWTRLYSSHYPTFWSSSNYLDVGSPTDNDYSDLAELNDFADATSTLTLRFEVGDSGTWNTGTRSHYTVWTQGHNPFTATTDGSDYTFIDGEESTTCGGFNGFHDKYYTDAGTHCMSSDVDTGDSVGCWWMQIVPLAQYSSYSGYLEGYNGSGNSHTWHTLWVK